jgi:hypothetical protein
MRTLITANENARRYPPKPVQASSLDAQFAAIAALLETAFVAPHSNLVFTARQGGLAGADISIEFIDPLIEQPTEQVAVNAGAIAVTLRSVSGVLSSAAQVKAAVEASEPANMLVSVEFAEGHDGSGIVADFGPQNLAAPDNPGFEYVPTGREVVILHNAADGPQMFTLHSAPDDLNRLGDIENYSLAAGAMAVLVPPLKGWQQADGRVWIDILSIGIEIALLRVPPMA